MGFILKISRAMELITLIRNQYWGLLNIPKLGKLEDICTKYDSFSLGITESSTLDIGCGLNPKNPFKAENVFGIDIRSNENNIRSADLSLQPIPFNDNTFDYITAHDFIEHVPRVIYAPNIRFAFVELMNEIWRSLKPNGIFLSRTPIYPYEASFRDPTHVNMITHETFPLYFSKESCMASMYGFRGEFEILEQAIRPPYLISILKKLPQY